ncbi:penicillin-binding protein 2 [Colwellia sp. M166]|uniref:penicillin-binding protein 2 n=1 Tax=Colwellia sp. M166 TaxID=2583805 RepID=UPI00211E9014|nr:penicillin-binding protein 2 [Colwellia sp. M166]UUO23001.1 penicillin-binding protein 2 [Colwellia sp. M166]|tara:strand:+ start:13396 stop:15375 length:1980 start_codon:yes stop_codon:yes gene_type:complete
MAPKKRVAIRNHSAEANLFARRTFITFIAVLILSLVLFSNIYNLEVNSYQKYQTRSNSNRIKLLPVAPNRGLIYDRNGVLLADNTPVYSLEVIPEQVDDIKKRLSEVSELLDISQEKQDKLFKELKSKRRFKPIEIYSRLSEQQVALFSVNQHKFPGFFIDARLKRYYPFADLTTHSLGYVARINRKDSLALEKQGLAENYAATRNIGKLGLEKYYQDILHGTIGHQEVEINNQGRVIRTLDFTPPIPGKDLTLTLDIELQMIAKRALSGKRGAVVAIDPRDGGVLAMYSNPSFDGNLFVHGISSKKYKKLLAPESNKPLLNRAVQGYPPASTIKPLLALTGLEAELITPETEIYDPGFYQLPGIETKRRDWKKWGHGKVNLTKSLEQSCNVYYYDLAYRLGITRISKMMEKFGFGDYTGIDIHEESRAIMPSIEWKRARYNKAWYTGETLSVGIGQSYWSVTPLQLSQAISILVNKGRIKVPHFLKATSEVTVIDEDADQQQPLITEYVVDEKRPITLKNQAYWDLVLDGLHNTVQKFGATGYSAFKGSKYDAAGKTGSAQTANIAQDEEYDAKKVQESKRDNAMFIAFAPYENPEIVVAVAIENVAKGGGGTNAGPVARQIMDQYFGDREIISTDKLKHPHHDEVYQQNITNIAGEP